MPFEHSPGKARHERTRTVPVWLAVIAASLPMFMATLDNLVMTNALPIISAELGASVVELQWFVNSYTLAFASAILLAVALGDRYGRRTVFLIGIALFTAGSIAAALSTDPAQLIASRAVQGFGAAAVMPLSLTLLAGSVPAHRRPLVIGIWGGVSGLGVATGPLVGGAVVEGWDWQAIFWINVPVGLASIALALVALPNSFGAKVRADLIGVVLAGTATLGVVYGIVRGNDAGWTSIEVMSSLVIGVVLLVGFIIRQHRAAAPLVPLRLFKDRGFSVANVVGFAFSFGIFGAIFILIQYLQVVQGSSPLQAAIQTSPWTLAPMVVAPVTGALIPRIGTRLPIVVGLLAQSAALLWIASHLSQNVAYSHLIAPFILAGVGMGLVIAPSATAVLATMGAHDHGKATGANSTIREIGIALGIAVVTAVFAGAGGQLTPDAYVGAAVPAVVVGAAALFLAAIVATLMPSGTSQRVPALSAAVEAPAAVRV